jgi:hypothetical protein
MFLYKTSLFAVIAILFINGCSEHSNPDKSMEKKLLGTWHKELKYGNKTLRVVTKFRKDHRFATYAHIPHSRKKLYATGRWRVKYGNLVETIQKSNYVQPGTQTYDKILHINFKQFVYKTESGEVYSYYKSRKKRKSK